MIQRTQILLTRKKNIDPLDRPEFYKSILKSPAATDDDLRLSLLELPNAPERPWFYHYNIPHGQMVEIEFPETIKKNSVPDNTKIGIYTPPNFDHFSDKPYPIVILFDGEDYFRDVQAPTIFDYLIYKKIIPPLVTVFLSKEKGRDPDLLGYDQYIEYLVNNKKIQER